MHRLSSRRGNSASADGKPRHSPFPAHMPPGRASLLAENAGWRGFLGASFVMSKLPCSYTSYFSSNFEKIRWCSLSFFFTGFASAPNPRILHGQPPTEQHEQKKTLNRRRCNHLRMSPSRPSLLRRRWNHIMQPGSEAIINKPRENLHENWHSLRLVNELAEELQVRGKWTLTPKTRTD